MTANRDSNEQFKILHSRFDVDNDTRVAPIFRKIISNMLNIFFLRFIIKTRDIYDFQYGILKPIKYK